MSIYDLPGGRGVNDGNLYGGVSVSGALPTEAISSPGNAASSLYAASGGIGVGSVAYYPNTNNPNDTSSTTTSDNTGDNYEVDGDGDVGSETLSSSSSIQTVSNSGIGGGGTTRPNTDPYGLPPPPPNGGGGGLYDVASGSSDSGGIYEGGNALEEHLCLNKDEQRNIRFEPGVTDQTRKMVLAYINSDQIALMKMATPTVNANVLWCAPQSTLMQPTITHAVLATQPTQQGKECSPFYVKLVAILIKYIRQLGGGVDFPDSTGTTARQYAIRYKVPRAVVDALEGKVRTDGLMDIPQYDDQCSCCVQ